MPDKMEEIEKVRSPVEILDELASLEGKFGHHPGQYDYLSRVLDLIHEWKDQRNENKIVGLPEGKKAA